MRPHLDILRDELNVKEIELTDDVQSVGRMELNLNPARLGPRLGGETQQVIKAHKAGDWTHRRRPSSWSAASSCSPTSTRSGSCRRPTASAATLPGNHGIVVLDTVVTDALERKGSPAT